MEIIWFKIKTGSKYADVSERTLREWLKLGLRHSRLPSGSIRIRREWIDEYLAGFEVQPEVNEVEKIVSEVMADL